MKTKRPGAGNPIIAAATPARPLNCDPISREDDEYIKRITEWKRLRAEHDLAGYGNASVRISHEIDALEGQIIAGYPATFRGLIELLEMTYAILAARDLDRSSLRGCGPVTMLVAQAVLSLENCSGEIYTPRGGAS